MLLNDSDNRLYDSLLEYDVLDKLDDLNRNKYDRYYQADFCQAENNLKDEFAELKKQRIHLGANGTEEIKMRMPMYLLTLGDKSRKAVHKWKEKTAYLPEYLSEETIEKVKMVDKEADEIISEGKIEDVLFYFDKLDDVEKLECIQKLQNRLNR